MFNNTIIFVLCRPEQSGNIGSVCRAIKTMCFSQLRIVGKKSDYEENLVHTFALESFDVWENALFFDSLQDAVADCTIAAGTTRRLGKKRDFFLLEARAFAQQVQAKPVPTAIVFGNERTGLTEEELKACTCSVTIPTNPMYGSLNLSHAVQIVAYELYNAKVGTHKKKSSLPLSEIDKGVKTMSTSLKDAGFFRVSGQKDMELFWRNIFSRAAVNAKELRYAQQIFTKILPVVRKKLENLSIDKDNI